LFGKLVYRIPLEQPVYILLLSIILAFTSTAIGLMIALLIQTENMGIAITQIIALGGAVLGGLWMPLEFMPDFVQKIAKVLPQYWGHQGIVGAMQGELDFRNFVLVFVVILGYGLLAFMLSLLIYP